jgi:hypothetical protein
MVANELQSRGRVDDPHRPWRGASGRSRFFLFGELSGARWQQDGNDGDAKQPCATPPSTVAKIREKIHFQKVDEHRIAGKAGEAQRDF